MNYRIIPLLWLISCSNPVDDGKCDLSPGWEVTLETTSGDCLPEGITETSTLTAEDLEAANAETCELERSDPFSMPETDETFGLEGEIRITVRFTNEEVTGTARLTADLTESGETIGTCEQRFDVRGHR